MALTPIRLSFFLLIIMQSRIRIIYPEEIYYHNERVQAKGK